MTPRMVVNHVGHCVTDLARSRRFYEELLGFEFWRELVPPQDVSAKLLGLEAPVKVEHGGHLTLDELKQRLKEGKARMEAGGHVGKIVLRMPVAA